MKKKALLAALAILAVGFAAVSTTLYINGTSTINSNDKDFKVYYSDAKVNGTQDLSVVTDETHLAFTTTLDTLGQTYVLDYDVTNGSKNYDADLEMTCTGGNDYLTVINEFDDETILEALKTRSGKLTLTQKKSNTGEDVTVTIQCNIKANAVERTSLANGTIAEPAVCKFMYKDLDDSGDISIGDEYTFCEEKFNVISQTDDDVTLFAAYYLGKNYRQAKNGGNLITFSNYSGWDANTDVDIQLYDGNAKIYVNEYVSYFSAKTGDNSIQGNLITMAELEQLGCKVYETELYSDDRTCTNSPYSSWLLNGQSWFTRSAYYYWVEHLMMMKSNGTLIFANYNSTVGIRPTLTISKETLRQNEYIPVEEEPIQLPTYEIGDEITLFEGETFNVISQTEDTVTMLAQSGIGTDYKQSSISSNIVKTNFSKVSGWEYTPGPKEIDINSWSKDYVADYVNKYISYLQSETDFDTITGDLITLTELGEIKCSISENYSYTDEETCINSPYFEWLINGLYWTRSADADKENCIWVVAADGTLKTISMNNFLLKGTIRPVITVSKEDLYWL